MAVGEPPDLILLDVNMCNTCSGPSQPIAELRGRWQETPEVAKAQARATHDKEVLDRRWNAGHGGVYARVKEEKPLIATAGTTIGAPADQRRTKV